MTRMVVASLSGDSSSNLQQLGSIYNGTQVWEYRHSLKVASKAITTPENDQNLCLSGDQQMFVHRARMPSSVAVPGFPSNEGISVDADIDRHVTQRQWHGVTMIRTFGSAAMASLNVG